MRTIRAVIQAPTNAAPTGSRTRVFISAKPIIRYERVRASGREYERPALFAQLPVLAIEARDFTRGLAINGAPFQIRALVVRKFANSYTELRFQLSIFPVEL